MLWLECLEGALLLLVSNSYKIEALQRKIVPGGISCLLEVGAQVTAEGGPLVFSHLMLIFLVMQEHGFDGIYGLLNHNLLLPWSLSSVGGMLLPFRKLEGGIMWEMVSVGSGAAVSVIRACLTGCIHYVTPLSSVQLELPIQ